MKMIMEPWFDRAMVAAVGKKKTRKPSAEETLIFTVPDITAYRQLPGSPLEKSVAPRFSVAS